MRFAMAAACLAAALWLLSAPAPRMRTVVLPAGVVDLSEPLEIASFTEVRGAPGGTTLRSSRHFRGPALVRCRNARSVVLRGFALDGNRTVQEVRSGLPPHDVPFARFTANNGILAENVAGLRIAEVQAREIAGFAILVNRSRRVAIARVAVRDSGSRFPDGANNTTGGILLEEGTEDFSVMECDLRGVRGNGVWTHSLYRSPRNRGGRIEANRFEEIGRDAIQIGHATAVRVEDNRGARIGFPLEVVDIRRGAVPVGLDTAGDVDYTVYARNTFEEVNGKCIDLDGFHDGEVRANTCRNTAPHPYEGFAVVMNNTNPDMRPERVRIVDNQVDGAKFGAIFVIGTDNLVARNRLVRLNLSRCESCYYRAGEPDLLQSGIYLGKGAERPAPARANTIEANLISGYGMKRHCIGFAPGIPAQANTIRANLCE